MTPSRPEALSIGVVILCGLVCATAVWMALSAAATPPDFTTRKSSLANQINEIERLARKTSGASSYGANAVCGHLDATNIARITQTISHTAAISNVRVEDFDLRPPDAPRARDRLATIAIRLQAKGDYGDLRGFIDHLAQSEPEVFVDRLDLAYRSPDVELKLTGKVFCWLSERP